MPRHPKLRACEPLARYLFVVGLCHVAEFLTDGFVAEADALELAKGLARRPTVLIQQLVKAGLWHAEPGGYRVHDYLDYNPSAAEEKAKRAARAEAGRLGGLAKALANAKGFASRAPSKTPSKIVARTVSVSVPSTSLIPKSLEIEPARELTPDERADEYDRRVAEAQRRRDEAYRPTVDDNDDEF